MTNEIQISKPLEVGLTRESYVKQVFDIATTRGDKLSINRGHDSTVIEWSNGFGMITKKPMSIQDEAYEAAYVYNTTLNLGISEPNIP